MDAFTDLDAFRIDVLLSQLVDPKMHRLVARLQLLAADRMPVLITGESGSGKEVVARALHRGSPRAHQAWVAINCGAIPGDLSDAELFGYERGAFTGASSAKQGLLEAADGGTILLDEIGELPLTLQTRLLRFLDDSGIRRIGATSSRAIDVRILAATNRDLAAEVLAGRFRRDLYYRISGAALHVPALRERPADIPVLAQLLLDRAVTDRGLDRIALSPDALHALIAYAWPGNLRELARTMELLAITATQSELHVEHLPDSLFGAAAGEESISSSDRDLRAKAVRAARSAKRTKGSFMPLAEEVARLEKKRMLQALEMSGGNARAAARLLQMPRRSFVRKTQRYGIRRA